MQVCRTIAEARARVAAEKAAGRSIGLVATMGAFHSGHIALMQAARARCDIVVVSLFVNPTQFDHRDDLERYPRVEDDDARAAASAGVDVLFAPSAAEMYPAGFSTRVDVTGLGDILEGEHRPGHFAGVATVVAKLLTILAPDVAVFGQKDAQQLHVIRRMATDLNLPVAIQAHATVRDADGLALSSRNSRLTPEDRERALALPRALAVAVAAVRGGNRDPDAITRGAHEIAAADGIRFEYLAVLDPDAFAPVERVRPGPVLLVAAARVGGVRLIDNMLATSPTDSAPGPP